MAWVTDLFRWQGKIGNRAYALRGIVLFFVKYAVDTALVRLDSGEVWRPWHYWSGRATHDPTEATLLLAASLPFIWIGTAMTLRRLRDIRWPAWLVILFFAPFLNLVLFFILSVLPSEPEPAPSTFPDAAESRLRQLGSRSAWLAALLAIALTVVVVLPLIYFGTTLLRTYGWALFVGLPFWLGLFSALIYSAAEPRTAAQCAGTAMLACLACVLGLLVFAMEGFICVLMVTPIALVLALLGAFAGYTIQRARWSRAQAARVYCASWLVLPWLMLSEATLPTDAPLHAVTTTCEIAAAPDAVWPHVVEFSELPPPHDWIFLSGVAYPVRARIAGRGVGAVRRCEFSTGPFVEPITAWEAPQRLAFDVQTQPEPMRELSPWRAIHPAHLDGFFRSRRGEFRLVALPGGRTRLEGTTWYEQRIFPGAYWQPWSDYLVHRIHARVLEHIKAETERSR